jgi:hypothetical protein
LVGVLVLYKIGLSIRAAKARKAESARLSAWEQDEPPTSEKAFGYYASMSLLIIISLISVLETLAWLVAKR